MRVGQEKRLLIGNVQGGAARRDQPVAAHDGVVHIGLRVRLGKKEATLRTPVPLVVRVEAATLLRRNEEVGSPDRALDLARERIVEEWVVGTVLRAHVTAERHVM